MGDGDIDEAGGVNSELLGTHSGTVLSGDEAPNTYSMRFGVVAVRRGRLEAGGEGGGGGDFEGVSGQEGQHGESE